MLQFFIFNQNLNIGLGLTKRGKPKQIEGWDPNTKSMLTWIPLLTTKAGRKDGAACTQRLKEVYRALIAYTQMNKSSDNDWFRILAAIPKGTPWTGKCWYVHNIWSQDINLRGQAKIRSTM
ncbi:hypothetical protein GOBAR_DD32485 [Gossypium barbadense]|nr:hypothetical protein GOBAR_DD32485 [Gossypium barbadense]